MLTRQLRGLEDYDIVERKVDAQVPPKVEYSLTNLGKPLDSILNVLHNWGVENIEMIKLKEINGESMGSDSNTATCNFKFL